jgi:hypothetical protein
MTPKEVLKKILALDIGIFSITDHNSGFNCAAFETVAREKDILFIPGIELQTSEEIHLLGYFPDVQTLNSFCSTIVKPRLPVNMKNDPERFGRQIKINSSGDAIGEDESMLCMPLNISIDEMVECIHDFNGVAVAAHMDRGFSIISQLGYIPPNLKLDAVEVRDISKIDCIRSEFLKGKDLNILCSSDSHYIDMMKAPKMKFWLKNADTQTCLNCIKGKGEGKITLDWKEKGRPRFASDSDLNTDMSLKDWKKLYK